MPNVNTNRLIINTQQGLQLAVLNNDTDLRAIVKEDYTWDISYLPRYTGTVGSIYQVRQCGISQPTPI